MAGRHVPQGREGLPPRWEEPVARKALESTGALPSGADPTGWAGEAESCRISSDRKGARGEARGTPARLPTPTRDSSALLCPPPAGTKPGILRSPVF